MCLHCAALGVESAVVIVVPLLAVTSATEWGARRRRQRPVEPSIDEAAAVQIADMVVKHRVSYDEAARRLGYERRE